MRYWFYNIILAVIKPAAVRRKFFIRVFYFGPFFVYHFDAKSLIKNQTLHFTSFSGSGYQNGAASVAVQGTVRQEEEGAVCRTPQSVPRGLEDRVQRRPQCGGLAQDGTLLLWTGLPDAKLWLPREHRNWTDTASGMRHTHTTETEFTIKLTISVDSPRTESALLG